MTSAAMPTSIRQLTDDFSPWDVDIEDLPRHGRPDADPAPILAQA
ncbi:hypothetical protein CCO02nite_26010 [Cellulomonas composti]|uniref:Uncharacterized protein n=1 Tax=Cellulomonas composti TaxID=266130 RepID=A0A511JDY3_9CELL|nr:hypothetical protein CCO02nite_26010 [Cellulomonas composti]